MRIRTTRTLVAAALATVALAVPASASAVTVFGAASLNSVFPKIDATPKYSFAGSDALALQIRNGAPADVFASANMSLPTKLFQDGLCTKPQVFATNLLVLVTPTANPAGIKSVYDLARGDKKRLAIGSATVPIGIYTRQMLGRLGLTRVLTINTVSSEPNVTSIASKVGLGTADAGFVYVSDWLLNKDRLKRISLPVFAQPPVKYGICTVKRPGADTAAAAKFIRTVLGPTGRKQLRAFGFGVPKVR